MIKLRYKGESFMYNTKLNIWEENGKNNSLEHFETTYYLKYNIERALYSLEKILKSEIDCDGFSNRCVYYHFYIDNLLNSVGHIRRRFFNNNVTLAKIERNRKEYDYNSIDEYGVMTCKYPIINGNEIRNFVEHIDEKDEILMNMGLYNGCFNVIYEGMDEQLKKALLSNERRQNNLLNLLTKEYSILTVNKNRFCRRLYFELRRIEK